MKNKAPSKPSKASLVARGLASKSKPPSLKRVQKSKEKPTKEAKPSCGLRASDSEDQAASVDRGLNRCAALLSDILNNEDKGFSGSKMRTKVSTSTKPVKPTAWRTTSHPSKLQRTEPQRSRAFNKHVFIPTANANDRASPSPAILHGCEPTIQTAYNNRLVSSTPVLTGEERDRRNQLQRREVELQQELSQLRHHYELLQKQQNPDYQKQQQRQLQSSMMQELENHQQMEQSPRVRVTPRGVGTHHTSELQTVLNSGNALIANSTAGKSSTRRSLDYSGFPAKDPVGDSSSMKEASQTQTRLSSRGGDHIEGATTERIVAKDASETQGVTPPESKKQVRIVSPIRGISPFVPEEEAMKSDPPNVHQTPPNTATIEALQGTRSGLSVFTTPPSLLRARPSSAPVGFRDRVSPTAAENQVRMVQYLIDELRALLGNTGDLEVDRLLSDIDDSVKLLPYMLLTDETTHDAERALQPLRVENSQLRRKLQIANQNLKRGSFKHREEGIGERADLAFELAACRSINTVLQKQLTEEKNNKEEILRSRDQLAQNLSELQEERKKFLQILSSKEQTFERCKREWQQETSRVIAENKKVKTDLLAVQFSTEAEKKEINILTLSIKQKDAEICRLKELTRGLQHSLSRLLSDIQQFQPNSSRNPGLLDTSRSFEGLDKLLGNQDKTKVQITSPSLSPNVVRSLSRSNGISLSPLATSRTLSGSLVERFSGYGERETWKWGGNTPSPLSGKKLRFAEAGDELKHPEMKNERTSSASHEGSLKEEQNGGDLSSLSSEEEEEFRRDLANLDADIARIQKSLRETVRRT